MIDVQIWLPHQVLQELVKPAAKTTIAPPSTARICLALTKGAACAAGAAGGLEGPAAKKEEDDDDDDVGRGATFSIKHRQGIAKREQHQEAVHTSKKRKKKFKGAAA